MSTIVQDAELRRAYGEIVAGFSTFTLNKKQAFIRHLSPLEQGVLDKEYLTLYHKALEAGLLCEEDRMKVLDADGLWTTAQEDKLIHQGTYVKGLEETKKTLALPSQVRQVNKELEEARLELITSRAQKYIVMGLTAESYANKKLNELYIFNSLFLDSRFEKTFFEPDEYDDLDEKEIEQIVTGYNTGIGHINERVIRCVSIAPFFTNYFYLCKDNIYDFYGKPIANLTYFQSELANSGMYFKQIFSGENRPPEHIWRDPEKIIEWYQTSTNTNKILGAAKGENVGIVGATQEDMKELGIEQNGPSAFDEAQKQGKKTLSMRELANMQ